VKRNPVCPGRSQRLDVARSLRGLGKAHVQTGDLARARVAFEEQRDIATALAAEFPIDAIRVVLAQSHNGIGMALMKTGTRADILAAFETTREIRQQLTDANAEVADFQRELADILYNIARVAREPAEALRSMRAARAIYQKLADKHPEAGHPIDR
jgi:hypothetical protein